MKWLDRHLRDLRFAQAVPFIRDGARVLDIGCLDPSLLRRIAPRVRTATGVDPLARPHAEGNIRVLRGTIPGALELPHAGFDCITMLAVLEHVPDPQTLARECARLLAPGGRVVITVPKPRVDRILAVLAGLRLIKGMSLEEHHGYDVRRTPSIFESVGLVLQVRRTFELGLNCLFVFEKPPGAAPRPRVVMENAPAVAGEGS